MFGNEIGVYFLLLCYKAHTDQIGRANKINKDKHEKEKPCKDKKMTKETNKQIIL